MCPFPVDQAARRRLQEAQRAEADALKTVEAAARVRDRAQRKLDTTDGQLALAQAELVGVSGIARAAILLAVDETVLRRRVRQAAAAKEHATPGS